MSLSLALNNALSGINVSQQSLAVLANNVSNANSPGYSRQVVEQEPRLAGSQGSGARVTDIVRKIDEYLNRAVRSQTSNSTSAETVSDYMSRIQIMLGQPGGSNSLDEYIEGFFNIVQSLAETPELTSYRYEAVNAGQILARELAALAAGLEDLRFQADQDIQSSVDAVNAEILRLDNINESIFRAQSFGEPISNFLDQRDLSLKRLAEEMDIRIIEKESGQVYVYTEAGVALLEHIPYQLQYQGVSNLETFLNDSTIPGITVDGLKDDGGFLGLPVELVSSGVNTDITTSLRGGRMKGLLDMRDKEIPNMLAQLDLIASELRDQFNAIHNAGSGLPPASVLSGTRATSYQDVVEWSGTVRFAVLNNDGTPVTSRYGDTDSGFLPLDLDLDALQSEYGDLLTTEVLMREINSHFLPQNKAVVGNLNNIELSSLSADVPDGSNNFSFDLELENISSTSSNFWVTNVTVLDDAAAPIGGAVTSSTPTAFNFDPVGTFTTSVGSGVVTVASTAHGLSEGDVIYMNGVSGPVNGIPAADFNGQAFQITNVTANSFDIEIVSGNVAVAGPPVNDAAATGLPAYDRVIPGATQRTGDNGQFDVDLSANLGSAYFTVQVDVMVEDDNGNLTASTVEYRVANNQASTFNKRYAARDVTGGGSLEIPYSAQPLMRAVLLDADGNVASNNEDGYLTLIAGNEPGTETQYTIAIDDLSSQELGRPNENPSIAGSGRGFSHYFGLNDFFVANEHIRTGDTVAGSAYAMAVREDIVADPNLISMGTLIQSVPPADPGLAPYYTYERTTGDNTVAQRLAALGLARLEFDAAGGLPITTKTFNGYASEVLGFLGGKAAAATSNYEDELALLEGFQERAESVSGVNIDEEMANTIIFQNAYSASAQVIRTVKELFDTLIATF